jgi:PHD/YefM family antitoxin component YafN of YafNO toxin-antitoxin module
MKIVSASAARQRFGAMLKAALCEPVFIHRQNRDVSVIISLDEYKRIRGIKNIMRRIDDGRPRHESG